jgi:predicted small lipoprotein YifL
MKQSARCVLVAAVMALLAGVTACGKNPTTAPPVDQAPPARQPTISIVYSATSGGKDTVVTVTVTIKDNAQEVGVFGMDLTFPPKMFDYTSVSKGNLTGNWAAVDGNEVSAGNLKIGGFKGSGTAVAINSSGSIVVITFKVNGAGLSNGQQGQVCIKNYTDDITGIPPEPACASFTLTE